MTRVILNMDIEVGVFSDEEMVESKYIGTPYFINQLWDLRLESLEYEVKGMRTEGVKG